MFTLVHEGGFSDHPADNGGATMLGITHGTLSAWRGKKVTMAELKALTKAEALEIYRANYWNPVQGDSLPMGVDLAVWDYAVNSGPGRAAKALQNIIGVPADGGIGPATLAAVAKYDPASLVRSLCSQRLAFLKGLDDWPVFKNGWSKRVANVQAQALKDIA